MAATSSVGVTRAALVSVGVVALAVAVVWLAGGFQPARSAGRAVPVGTNLELARWQVRIDRAEITNRTLYDSEADPAVRVWLRIAFTGTETECCLPEKLLTVRAGAVELTEAYPASGQPRTSNFDPDVAADLALDFTLPADVDPPAEVTVVVRDEEPRQNFLIGDLWGVTEPVALVTVPAADRRVR